MAWTIWIDVPRAGLSALTRRIAVRRAALLFFLTSVSLARRIDAPRPRNSLYKFDLELRTFNCIFLHPPSNISSSPYIQNFSAARPSSPLTTPNLNIKIRFIAVRRVTLPPSYQPSRIFFFPLRGALPRHQHQALKSKFEISRSRERGYELLVFRIFSFAARLPRCLFFRCAVLQVDNAHFIQPLLVSHQVGECELCLKSHFKLSECSNDSGFSADFKFTGEYRLQIFTTYIPSQGLYPGS
ncbi:hypothetical protein R3P38DRAFT_2782845 [Favolaschia claudopus]|uniref:Uncharacterized protein n=1 Tax=Favolaschia claudopus TaxID=2862362 RepID=A0AAW0B1L1_9AGAR